MFPYKIQSQSELTPEQRARRLKFAQWFSKKLETDEHFIEKIYMTDESSSAHALVKAASIPQISMQIRENSSNQARRDNSSQSTLHLIVSFVCEQKITFKRH